MRTAISFSLLLVLVTLGLLASPGSGTRSSAQTPTPSDGRKPPEVRVLGLEATLGKITFSHIDHITKNRNLAGTAPMACIECHHTAQPAVEAAKHPPLKTAWPTDRTSTLTIDQFDKDPQAPVVVVCRDCHSRAETKPKLLPEIPQIKLEEGTALITVTNKEAFHRNCAGCHDEVVKNRKDANPPTSKKCMLCHKKAAA